jgi:hypothetical protein
VFQGANDSAPVEFGGHVILRRGKQIQIIGAEFTQLGQKGLIGRYPQAFFLFVGFFFLFFFFLFFLFF